MKEPASVQPLLGLLLAHQRRAWLRGGRAPVESYLARQPALAAAAEAVLDLIYNEVVLRAEAGESPRLEEYLRRFPHLAPQLELQFALEGALWPGCRSGGDETLHAGLLPPVPSSVPPTIPGYEVLGELGRGGMGVVYKARQVGLNRVVALKMILAGAHAPPEAAVRFLAEAEAVARLQHPNIVQIHALGDHEGRPYYEMEYAPGGSLADRLDGTPWPARDAARLVGALADALREAHRLGIVHRDIKPANVLLGADGTPRVADFGLARWLDAGSGLTRTDHIVGSPSYMAPEQAGGGASAAGPAADVYSLGAILYELLAGRPPFRAATVLGTLEQVKSAEPVPPSRLRPGLPRDLDTVCLTCLQKDPARRYSGADLLAEDLRRFEAGEPVRARPVGLAERAWRWCRREPALAALVAVLAAGLVGVTTQWWRAERHLRLEMAAHRALREARRRSEERFALGIEAVGAYATLTVEEDLLGEPRLDGLRRTLLGRALGFYQGLQASLEADPTPEARSQLAAAYEQVGWIQAETGANAQALKSQRRALALWEALSRDDPRDAEARSGMGRSRAFGAAMLRAAGRRDEAMRLCESALAIQRPLVRDHGAVDLYRSDLAWFLANLGALQGDSRRAAEAVRSHGEAVAIREALARARPGDPQRRRELAWSRNDLGAALEAAGRPVEALASYRRALALWEALAGADPADAGARWGAVRSLSFTGSLLLSTGRADEAVRSYEQALAIARALAREHPGVLRYKAELGWCLGNLGTLLRARGRPDEAVRLQRAALAIREALARDLPEDLHNQAALACSQRELGLALEAAGRPAESVHWAACALRTNERLARSRPADVTFRYGLAASVAKLGLLQRRAGDPDAPRTFDRLVAIREALAHDHASASDRAALASSYLYRATVRAAAGRRDEALSDIRRAERISECSPDVGPNVHYNLACAYAQCSTGERGDSTAAERAERRSCAERAMAALRRAAAGGFTDVALVRRDLDLDPLRRRRDFQDVVLDLVFPADPFAR